MSGAEHAREVAWDELARAAARGRDPGTERLRERQILAFVLDGSAYALPVERVREIGRMRPVTPIPRVPCDVCGVISLRGEIVQLIDLRGRLGLGPAPATRSSRIVVVHADDGGISALLVDAVTEVVRVPDEAMRPAPSGEVGAVEALCVRGDEFISLLELNRVLDVHAEH